MQGFREHRQSFNAIGLAKVRALGQLLAEGADVLLSDVDVVWMASPVPYLRSGHLAAGPGAASTPPPERFLLILCPCPYTLAASSSPASHSSPLSAGA